ncbi:MAG: hypothetical protein HN584_11830 [Akkermansiaceae bacterium]|jgi:translation initiation factor IF-1|nr:hypothetical protein [Akkermansiaceae bacterium]MDG1853656.1 hypothetical protein [Verrucomicrobiales bacterium]
MSDQDTTNEGGPIIGKATVIEQLTESIILASLPNGKIIYAHLPMKIKEKPALTVGKSILVKMNPYDFSHGRIIIDK